MMSSVATALAALVVAAIAVRMAANPFSSRRARLEIRSVTGENLAVVLAVATILDVIVTVAVVTPASYHLVDLGRFLAIGALAAVIGLAVAPRAALAALSLIALTAFVIEVIVVHGPELGLLVATALVLLLVLLALIRGFTPRRA